MRLARPLNILIFALPLVFFTLFGIWLVRGLLPSAQMPYAEFERLLAAGRVERVVVRGERAEVTLRPPEPGRVQVSVPTSAATPDSGLIAQLEAQGVSYRFERASQWLGILLNFLPVLFFLLVPLGLLTVLLVLVLRRRPPRAL